MKTVRLTGRALRMLVSVCTALALTAGVAQAAAEPHPHVGKLPGYPAIRGVVPVLGSKAAVSAHEKLVKGAFAAVRARRQEALKGAPVPNEEFVYECAGEEEFEFTQDMCYRGGPVLHGPTLHLIFWQGPGTAGVTAFPPGYEETVERYFEAVSHDTGLASNVFAIDRQYGEEQTAGAFREGEYKLVFNTATDVATDVNPFPTHLASEGCLDESEFAEGPCLLDSDLQNEVVNIANANSWPLENLENIYVVLTAPGVGGCFEHASGECAYRQYCAYHSDFGGNGMTAGKQDIYVDLPYLGEVRGCDSGVHPNEEVTTEEEAEGKDFGADAVIDTASHEVNEAVTDPIGSQCDEGLVKGKPAIIGCEHNAWTDVIGQEVADKCLPPESTLFGIYGGSLGELLTGRAASRFNQEIDGGHYYTQREWSNEAGLFEGGCVQRVIGASFTISAGAQATVPTTLDGSSSGSPGDPAVYWVWDILNTEEQFDAESPTLSHAFATPGEYVVALTAYDRYRNAETTVESFTVGPAPAPPPPLAPNVITIKEPITPGHLTAGQMATKLGLRVTKLSGKGPFTLGRAECPPACGVTLQLYAKVPTAPGSRHRTKLVLIGSAHVTLGAKGAKKLVLSLNAKGKTLLRAHRSLKCRLVVTVEGQEGGTWQIVRLPTLTR